MTQTAAQRAIHWLVVTAFALQVADGITTLAFQSALHSESNRLLNAAASWIGFAPAVILAKAFCCAAIAAIYSTWRAARHEMPSGPYLLTIGGLDVVMAFVILNNIR